MGTVLLFLGPGDYRPKLLGFSPLLDGDGVAFGRTAPVPWRWMTCFSPLLDGDGVASVSNGDLSGGYDDFVSVPFSMGTVLHSLGRKNWIPVAHSFSPLLDGDGVASCQHRRQHRDLRFRFSPLLDGDGVASLTS